MKTENSGIRFNPLRYFISYTTNGLVVMMTTGSVLQTFLLENGMSEERTGTYFSIIQALRVLTIFLFSGVSDKIRPVIGVSALSRALCLPFTVFLLFLPVLPAGFPFFVMLLLAVTTFIFSAAQGAYSVIAYKLPYHIIDMKNYGRFMSISGILSGGVCLFGSWLLSYMQGVLGYFPALRYAYLSASVLVLLTTGIILSFREKETIDTPKITEDARPADGKRPHLLAYRPFYALIVPNLFRGFASGIVGMAVTMGYFTGAIDSAAAAKLVIISNAVTLLGCSAFAFLSGRMKEKFLLPICAASAAVTIPLMLVSGSSGGFLVFYGVTFFFVNIVDYCVPVAVTKIVDYDMAGVYSGGRMLLHTAGSSLAGALCIPMLRFFGVLPAAITVSVMYLLFGAGYAYYLRKQ